MNEVALEVKNVSKSFRLRDNHADSLKETITGFFGRGDSEQKYFHALSDVSFEVREGESLGIIGKNGAGKSTLLKILSGIMQPDAGEINFYGKTVSILDVGAGFHPELSGRENIYLSASLYHFSRKETESRFQEIVEFSGVEQFIDEPVKNYSAGMYLRLAFSIITCLEADIYLLDEVINVGDANFQVKCKTKIEELISKGKTLLIASHNLNEISVLCNKIILLEDGRLAQPGNSDVIQRYLTTALPDFFSFGGKEFFLLRKPGESLGSHKFIAGLSYGIDNYQTVQEGINNAHSFTIFIELELLLPMPLGVTLKFFDSTGVLVFVYNTAQIKNQIVQEKGKYRFELIIPGNLLNHRVYTADIVLMDMELKTPVLRIEKFLTLKMANHEPPSEESQVTALPGVVKPLILTSVRKVE